MFDVADFWVEFVNLCYRLIVLCKMQVHRICQTEHGGPNCLGQIASIATVRNIETCEFLIYVHKWLPKTDSLYLLGSFLCLHVATVAVSYIWSLYCVHLHSYNSEVQVYVFFSFFDCHFPSLSKTITSMVKPSGSFCEWKLASVLPGWVHWMVSNQMEMPLCYRHTMTIAVYFYLTCQEKNILYNI